LDWHGTFESYAAAKQRLLIGQRPEDATVLNSADRQVAGWRYLAQGRVLEPCPDQEIPTLSVRGPHNRANAACALAAAAVAGCSVGSMQAAVAAFRGLPHRFETVATIDGRHFINDSKATTPEASIEAVMACDRPCWLLAGGHDKGADFTHWAERIAQRVRGVALFGAAREVLHEKLTREAPNLHTIVAEQMTDGFDWCWRHSSPGDAILLSPACASFDQFDDFEQRGRFFASMVDERCAARAVS
jgi:UDP-N-acetylmuramoylalanine--D-glutamate ligase